MSSSGYGDDENNNNGSNKSSSNQQADGLSIFCREVRNLLRSKPNCMIPFSKFVPAYHNHYGRQCCVYQFGYTKLIELLESIPHVVQIVGEGTNRYITLTHREQIKRFASDLIKVVKSQPGKKLKLSNFPRAYEQVLSRKFYVEDYGTNNINVLLAEIWEGTINIMPIKKEFVDDSTKNLILKQLVGQTTTTTSKTTTTTTAEVVDTKNNNNNNSSELISKPYITEQYPDAWFEIPKRERSDKEIKRTKYFVWDVIELLSNLGPNYSVPFSKFIPSYHYYFNRQCKVSIFGFSKLIDLFESISPDVVEIIDQGPGEEKLIKLSDKYKPKKSRDNNSENKFSDNIKNNGNNKCKIIINDDIIDDNYDVGLFNQNKNQNNNKIIINHFYGNNEDQEEEEEQELEQEDGDVAQEDDNEDESIQEDDEDDYLVEEEDDYVADDDYDDLDGDDVILPVLAIDSGPTEEELMELEDELKAYEELRAIESKRSSRMAAWLGVHSF